MDEEFWGDPTVFRPERFLDEFGEIVPQYTERIAIFGFGKVNIDGIHYWATLHFLFF